MNVISDVEIVFKITYIKNNFEFVPQDRHATLRFTRKQKFLKNAVELLRKIVN